MSWEAWGSGDEFFEDNDHLLDAGWDDPDTAAQKTALLAQCRTVLANMAEERTGFWSSLLRGRWPIHHEPLRNDARHIVPLIDQVIGAPK